MKGKFLLALTLLLGGVGTATRTQQSPVGSEKDPILTLEREIEKVDFYLLTMRVIKLGGAHIPLIMHDVQKKILYIGGFPELFSSVAHFSKEEAVAIAKQWEAFLVSPDVSTAEKRFSEAFPQAPALRGNLCDAVLTTYRKDLVQRLKKLKARAGRSQKYGPMKV